jgi:leader peptidase (prepilin peptidase)/N-methyltransferase
VPDWLVPLLVAPFIGSFLGVLIRRLPAGRSVVVGRSACEACDHLIAARDLVPLLGYLALRGRCRHCDAPIAAEHPAIEAAALAVAAIAAASQPDSARIWAGCVLGWGLLALAWIDWAHLRLPDALTLPLLLLGLAATALLDPGAVADHAAAAALGYLAFQAVGWCYHRLRGRAGLGMGDAKLLAASGAWVGLVALPDVVLAGALLGLATAALQALRGGRKPGLRGSMPIPFGPGLALATWGVWLAMP